jgi:hypothetical protein
VDRAGVTGIIPEKPPKGRHRPRRPPCQERRHFWIAI